MKKFSLTDMQRFIIEFFDEHDICTEWIEGGFATGLTAWIPYPLIQEFKDLFPSVAFQEPFVEALLQEHDICITHIEELLGYVNLDPEIIRVREVED